MKSRNKFWLDIYMTTLFTCESKCWPIFNNVFFESGIFLHLFEMVRIKNVSFKLM